MVGSTAGKKADCGAWTLSYKMRVLFNEDCAAFAANVDDVEEDMVYIAVVENVRRRCRVQMTERRVSNAACSGGGSSWSIVSGFWLDPVCRSPVFLVLAGGTWMEAAQRSGSETSSPSKL
jgi:hypothetical protein